MASSFFQLLCQQNPRFQTGQALVILGLQHDFLSEAGHLQLSNHTSLLDRLKDLVPAFRTVGHIYWIRTENRLRREDAPLLKQTDPDLVSESSDPESFLDPKPDTPLCCDPEGPGATYPPPVVDLQASEDTHLVKTSYSAFQDTSLLTLLRSRLTTEIYLVGCITNLCVYATARDAAQYGLQINLVEDCLGYRILSRHVQAMHRMTEDLGALVTTSSTVMARSGHDIMEVDESPDHLLVSDPEGTPPVHSFSVDDYCTVDKAAAPLPTPNAIADYKFNDFTTDSTNDHSDSVRKASELSVLSSQDLTSSNPNVSQAPISPSPVTRVQTALQQLTTDNPVSVAGTQSQLPYPPSSSNDFTHIGPATDMPLSTPDPSIMFTTDTDFETQRDTVAYASDLRNQQGLSPHSSKSNSHNDRKRRSADMMTDASQHLDGSLPGSAPFGLSVPAASNKRPKRHLNLANLPAKMPGDEIGSGDSSIVHDLFPQPRADELFNYLLVTVPWQTMVHATGPVPRLVCCQGDTDAEDGSMPVYRHPTDSLIPLLHWSRGVRQIRDEVEQRIGHRLNHVLIQLYRGGHDHISEHSDKTLDIVPGSKIVNVSFGAQRTMRLRTKKPSSRAPPVSPADDSLVNEGGPATSQAQERITERIHLPHNSMFVLGLETNAKFLHGIQQDKRLPHDLAEEEMAFDGLRISLTFRHIGTFISHDSRYIWGQGATSKSKEMARQTINGQSEEANQMITMFGVENQTTDFDWHATYGAGSDVLNLKTALPDQEPVLVFLSGRDAEDKAVLLYLSILGLTYQVMATAELSRSAPASKQVSSSFSPQDQPRHVSVRDTDQLHTQVSGLRATLLYLDRAYRATTSRAQLARESELLFNPMMTRLEAALFAFESFASDETRLASTDVGEALSQLEQQLHCTRQEIRADDTFLAGPEFGVIDCMVYPLAKQLLAACQTLDSIPLTISWLQRLEAVLAEQTL